MGNAAIQAHLGAIWVRCRVLSTSGGSTGRMSGSVTRASSLPITSLFCFDLRATSFSFGAAFTPFYRLTGPFAHPSASHTARTELWDTIQRRGLLGNLAMGLIPMVFYAGINALALFVELVWILCGRPGVLPEGMPKGLLG